MICRKTLSIVLILIILEYIYIRKERGNQSQWQVLILIILEYIYIFFMWWDYKTVKCLNPYYTGIHLHTEILRNLSFSLCLNPYYTGIHLHEFENGMYKNGKVS